MSAYRIAGREGLRLLIRAGHCMDSVARYDDMALIHPETVRRFTRLWAVSTATEHPYTAGWSLDRWRSRRERVRQAIQRARVAA